MLKSIALSLICFSCLADTTLSNAKISFEHYMSYTNSSSSKIVNDYLSQRAKDEQYDVLATGSSEQIEMEKMSLTNIFKKMEFVSELSNESYSCLFYDVTYADNKDLILPGTSLRAIFKMVYELGKWKYDGYIVNLTEKSDIEICKEDVLSGPNLE